MLLMSSIPTGIKLGATPVPRDKQLIENILRPLQAMMMFDFEHWLHESVHVVYLLK